MNARSVIDEMARFFTGPLKPYDELHIEDVELKIYDRKHGKQKWYFKALVYYHGQVYQYRMGGHFDERLPSKIDWEKRREQRIFSQPPPIFTVSSRMLNSFEEKVRANPLIWKIYTEQIKPDFDKALANFDDSIDKSRSAQTWRQQPALGRIDPSQFLGPGVLSLPKDPDEILEYPWMDLQDIDQLLAPYRYINASTEYGVEQISTRRGHIGPSGRKKGIYSDERVRLATFIHKLGRPRDSLVLIKPGRNYADWRYVLLSQEEREKFKFEVQQLARGKVGGMLDR